MSVTQDQLFEFDVRGYLHLRAALSAHEIAEYLEWASEVDTTSVADLNSENPELIEQQLNRPLSRVIDADPRFLHFLDHPAVEPLLTEFLGRGYRHVDNDLYYTYPQYNGGVWHRGVRAHPTGHVVGGRFVCPMVKVFYCLTDVTPGRGEFVVVPGSHKAEFDTPTDRLDLPGQWVFDDVAAGDVIIFNEALLHNGRPNLTDDVRKTVIVNFGREDAGVWPGYSPKLETVEAATPRRREILASRDAAWTEPEFATA